IGAILSVTVPATMMRSDCRGLGRKIPAPKRSMSKREAPVAIISIAQQANPNVIGQRADLRAQLNTKSTVVVMIFFSNLSSIHAGINNSVFTSFRSGPPARLHLVHRFAAPLIAIWPVPHARSSPIQRALLNDPNVPYDQNTKKHEHFGQAEQRELPVDDGPREKKNSFNVENDEKNRDYVIADCVTLTRIRIRIDAELIWHELALSAGLRADQSRDQQCHDRKKKSQCHEDKDGYVSRQC